MHPADFIAVGWDAIRTSWENFAKISSNGKVELSDQRIYVGENLAYEIGFEHVNVLMGKDQVQPKFRVTNVYRREISEWKMVHHHVDFDPRIREIVRKLETTPQA